MLTRFHNRTEAGQLLAQRLLAYANRSDVLVLGLPRGGVPIASEVAKALNVPLDICLVQKLTVPAHKEQAMGAIASRGIRVLNYDVISGLNISNKTLEHVAARELRELQRRDRCFRGDRPSPQIRDRTLILIDDGMVTGSTMRAAIEILRQEQPQKIVVAVPVAPRLVCDAFKAEVDEVVCLKMPDPFYEISFWYENFAQINDEEVHLLLTQQPTANHQPSFAGLC